MTETVINFSPSINVERDFEKDLDYVVTRNASQIYDQLIRNINSGTHSFSIIGSYGTGKSSFLLALKKNLSGINNYFGPLNGSFPDIKEFEFDFLVGQYDSIINNLASHFKLEEETSEQYLLKWIAQKHDDLKKEGKFWVIAIDEFGKHLEYVANENPERELYFVQLLAEFANEPEKNIFFITTLHQGFDSYAHGLDVQQKKEWDKIKGRLKELTFNEPVEQLLYIAGEYLKGREKSPNREELKQLLRCIESSRIFPLKNELKLALAEKLYPLEPLTASVLCLALQSYGQNERSLFTFLQSDEQLGINDPDHFNDPHYNLSCVYDYLIHNHHSFLSSKYNPHYLQWNAIKKAIERVETIFDKNVIAFKKIVKTIGLLNIFALTGASIDRTFLVDYSKFALSIKNVDVLLTKLEEKKIIRYRVHKSQFILYEGTDIDIEFELLKASSKIDPIKDIIPYLQKYFDLPYVPAKRAYYETGAPRFFKFRLSQEPILESPKQPIDGFVNLIFDCDISNVIEASRNNNGAVLYGIFNNTEHIKRQLFLIEKTKYLINEIGQDDKVAKRELKDLYDSQIEKLNGQIIDSIYGLNKEIEWLFKGEKLKIYDSKSFNDSLSRICEEIYFKTPVFRNELINKEQVSPAIYKPRKELLKLLLDNSDKEDLGFDPKTFPAEKTIYRSLLKNNDLHREFEGKWQLTAPEEGSDLFSLWQISEDFFNSTKSGKKSLLDFIGLLRKPPLGLKMGFIELWVPIFLIIKKNDYALYQEEAYVPEINYEIINLVYRNPKLFQIKAFHLSEIKKSLFEKYRSVHGQDESVKFSNKSFVETIKPFLLIFNSLNEYGRKTTTISKTAQRLRDAIKSATDPEEAFFSDFLYALGYTDLEKLNSDKQLQKFAYDLDKCIDEIKNSFNRLLNRIEECLIEIMGFRDMKYDEYIQIVRTRYDSIKPFKLVPYQKKLLGRLISHQPDKEKWISAVSFAILDKPLSKIDDEDEDILLDRLAIRIGELDTLRDLSKLHIDPKKQEAFNFKLQSFSKTPIDINLVIDKDKIDAESNRIQKLRSLLTNDKKLNTAILLKILENQGNHD